MKNLFLIFFLIIHNFSYSQDSENMEGKPIEVRGNIIKIDSINSFYFIFVQSPNEDYKIISRKNVCIEKLVEIGNCYFFTIEPIFNDAFPGNYLIYIGDSTYTTVDWGNTLYRANELCGLCYDSISTRLIGCKKQLEMQDRIDNSILYFYFHYGNGSSSGLKFFSDSLQLNKKYFSIESKKIPIIASNIIDKSNLIKLHNGKHLITFTGFILYEYQEYYFVMGSDILNTDEVISGWIKKEFFREHLKDIER